LLDAETFTAAACSVDIRVVELEYLLEAFLDEIEARAVKNDPNIL
jgi:hypothetical protein